MRESPLIILWLDNLGLFYPLIDQLPVLGEVTFDRATRRYFNLKQTDFDRETGMLTLIKGAPRLADFVGPALVKRLIPPRRSFTRRGGHQPAGRRPRGPGGRYPLWRADCLRIYRSVV